MSGDRQRIVVVFPDHPYPLDMGSRVRNHRIAEALSRRFTLTLVTQVHDPKRLEDPGPIRELGEWVPVLAPHRRSLAHRVGWHVRARWAERVEGIHRETFFQSLPQISRTVARLVEERSPFLVHAAYWYTLRHLRELSPDVRWIVDTHDVQFDRHARLWGRSSRKEKAREIAELLRYDDVVAITRRDRGLFEDAFEGVPRDVPARRNARLHVIPMGPDLEHWNPDGLTPARDPGHRLAFYGNLGNGHNAEAAHHLVSDLAPRLAARVPGVEVLLVGAQPPAALKQLAQTSSVPTEVTGFVDDPRPWLMGARVLALSLRSGSGQRGRVLEALALGIPVVGYAGAFEGLELADGDGIRIVTDEDRFVDALEELVVDPAAARNLGRIGQRCTRDRYDFASTYGQFIDLYTDYAGGAQTSV